MSGFWHPRYSGKPAAAVLDYSYSFATEIAENEPSDTITSATIAISPQDGSLGASRIAAADGAVTFWLEGGIAATEYTLSVAAITAEGRTLVSEPNPVVAVV